MTLLRKLAALFYFEEFVMLVIIWNGDSVNCRNFDINVTKWNVD